MFQIVFVVVLAAVAAFGFIFFSTTSDGAEESPGMLYEELAEKENDPKAA